MSAGGPRELSVVVPTIGRTDLLRRCLESIGRCDPAPDEVVVVDQSGGAEVGPLATSLGARAVHCDGRGIPLAVNTGLRAARSDHVAVTHDDCTVDARWAGVAAERLAGSGSGRVIHTGRVTPVGDPRAVPATRDEPEPRGDFEEWNYWAILPNNMAVDRAEVLAMGGFDERFDFAGEDLDLAYRWLGSGRSVAYVPEMRAWHHDWRSPRQMRRTYVQYARGCGLFYAKHLRAGDRSMARLVQADAKDLIRGAIDLVRRTGPPPWADDRLGAMPGLFVGLAQGWRRFAP